MVPHPRNQIKKSKNLKYRQKQQLDNSVGTSSASSSTSKNGQIEKSCTFCFCTNRKLSTNYGIENTCQRCKQCCRRMASKHRKHKARYGNTNWPVSCELNKKCKDPWYPGKPYDGKPGTILRHLRKYCCLWKYFKHNGFDENKVGLGGHELGRKKMSRHVPSVAQQSHAAEEDNDTNATLEKLLQEKDTKLAKMEKEKRQTEEQLNRQLREYESENNKLHKDLDQMGHELRKLIIERDLLRVDNTILMHDKAKASFCRRIERISLRVQFTSNIHDLQHLHQLQMFAQFALYEGAELMRYVNINGSNLTSDVKQLEYHDGFEKVPVGMHVNSLYYGRKGVNMLNLPVRFLTSNSNNYDEYEHFLGRNFGDLLHLIKSVLVEHNAPSQKNATSMSQLWDALDKNNPRIKESFEHFRYKSLYGEPEKRGMMTLIYMQDVEISEADIDYFWFMKRFGLWQGVFLKLTNVTVRVDRLHRLLDLIEPTILHIENIKLFDNGERILTWSPDLMALKCTKIFIIRDEHFSGLKIPSETLTEILQRATQSPTTISPSNWIMLNTLLPFQDGFQLINTTQTNLTQLLPIWTPLPHTTAICKDIELHILRLPGRVMEVPIWWFTNMAQEYIGHLLERFFAGNLDPFLLFLKCENGARLKPIIMTFSHRNGTVFRLIVCIFKTAQNCILTTLAIECYKEGGIDQFPDPRLGPNQSPIFSCQMQFDKQQEETIQDPNLEQCTSWIGMFLNSST